MISTDTDDSLDHPPGDRPQKGTPRLKRSLLTVAGLISTFAAGVWLSTALTGGTESSLTTLVVEPGALESPVNADLSGDAIPPEMMTEPPPPPPAPELAVVLPDLHFPVDTGDSPPPSDIMPASVDIAAAADLPPQDDTVPTAATEPAPAPGPAPAVADAPRGGGDVGQTEAPLPPAESGTTTARPPDTQEAGESVALLSPPKATPTANRSAPEREGRYTVQVGSFTVPANAQRMEARLREQGFDSYSIVWSDSDGQTWRVVRIGHLPTRKAAERLRQTLQAKAKQRGDIIRLHPEGN